jgi:hypothetical protein
VSQKGIEVNSENIGALLNMKSSYTTKEVCEQFL